MAVEWAVFMALAWYSEQVRAACRCSVCYTVCAARAAILRNNRCAGCKVCECRCSGCRLQSAGTASRCVQSAWHWRGTASRCVQQGAGAVSRCARREVCGCRCSACGHSRQVCAETIQGAGAEQRGGQHPARVAAAWATLTMAAPISQPAVQARGCHGRLLLRQRPPTPLAIHPPTHAPPAGHCHRQRDAAPPALFHQLDVEGQGGQGEARPIP